MDRHLLDLLNYDGLLNYQTLPDAWQLTNPGQRLGYPQMKRVPLGLGHGYAQKRRVPLGLAHASER